LTLASAALFAEDQEALKRWLASSPELRADLAALSREGSGSSCRSLDGPYVAWEGERARALPLTSMPRLSHFVLIVSTEPKTVSSSEAHTRVKTSPLWSGRPGRANDRLTVIESALRGGDLRRVATESWLEAWEMHSLFHTSNPSFSYWEPGTLQALQFLAPFVSSENPPIVTLDAGPNVHLLVRADEQAAWRTRLTEAFPEFRLLEDAPGLGGKVLS
jgi:diphosphomevalonate decarboxylase